MGKSVGAGKFVTFEGIEGSGKSCQLLLLAQELRQRQIPFVSTQQPGGTPFGRELREVLLRSQGPQREPLSELLLYLADRFQHLKEIIEPALSQGCLVICDRYHDATLAYQGYARGIGFSTVDALTEVLQLRMPDLTLVLDVEVEIGLERARQRNERDQAQEWGRFEAEDLDFHRKVQEAYRLLAKRDSKRVFLVEASGTSERVFEAILSILESQAVL